MVFKATAAMKRGDWLTPVYALLLFLAYRSTLGYLVFKWQDEDFTYCWMIPLVVLYLVWEKRQPLTLLPSRASWPALLPLGAGMLFYWLGELSGEFTLLFCSLWLTVVSLCWLHLGWAKLKVLSFPLCYLAGMFIPPNALYLPLTLRLKLISSQLSVTLMQCYGLSAYREGNVIDLGFAKLQVVDACSGLRYVLPLLLMGVLLAYYFRAPFWKRVLLVLSTVPLSILTNSLRIASVGILYQFWGAAAAEGFFHEFSGWFIFMAGMGFLLGEMWLLKRVPGKGRGAGESAGLAELPEPAATVTIASKAEEPRGAWWRDPHFAVAAGVLLLTATLATVVDFKEKTPLVKPFSSFPLTIGPWTGTRIGMEQEYLDALNLSDYALLAYRDQQGKEISLYAAYNASQSKGEATHSPASCLPGSGWVFHESGNTTLPAERPGETPIRVCRAFMEKNGERQLVYFWFPQRGRNLTSLYQVKFYNFWDALTRHRTDGALVRVITPVYGSERAEDAERRLQAFVAPVAQQLKAFIPD